jgi:hypothetical protein
MSKKETSFLVRGIQCPDCKEIVISLHRHDFRTCGCYDKKGNSGVFIDGGRDYTRVVFTKQSPESFKIRISNDVVI